MTAAGLIFTACPPAFRVLYDETAFLNSAQALLVTGRPGLSQEWTWSGGMLSPLEEVPSFRPALFPLLVAIPGFPVGPAAWHGFFVSFFATGGLFALLCFCARSTAEAAFRCALTAGGAVFCFTAASSGYDLLSLSLGFLSCLLLYKYESERKAATLAALLGAGLCFAHTRNEGILGFLAVWVWLALRRRREMSFSSRLLMGCSLILLAPLIAQRIAFYPHVELHEIDELVSPVHLPGNVMQLLKAFFFDFTGPFPVLVHYLGAWFLVARLKEHGEAAIPVFSFLAALLLFLMCFHAGGVQHPFQARLFLPFSFALCYCAASAWRAGPRWRAFGLATIGVQLALCIPNLQKGYLYFQHDLVSEAAVLRPLVENSPPKAVFVYFSSGMAAAFGRPGVRPKTFERDKAAFSEMLKREAAGPVYLVESWPPHKGTTVTTLREEETRLLEEIPLPGLRYLRVLELTSAAGTPAPEPK